jgi:hypothetical protein
MKSLPALIVFALVLSACGQPRRFGDDGGVPVTFNVRLERGFVSDMKNRQARPSVGAGVGVGSGGHSSFGTGVGVTFTSTIVYLLGGDVPGSGQVFRKELEWGANTFQVPLRPGRSLTLTVQVQGAREGWESIGQITAPEQPGSTVHVTLLDAGGTVAVDTGSQTTTTTTTTITPSPPATP